MRGLAAQRDCARSRAPRGANAPARADPPHPTPLPDPPFADLVSLKSAAAGAAGADAVRTATAAVGAQFEKDASLQQKSIEAAIKALREGVTGEDLVAPVFKAALQAAEADAAAKPASNPFKSAQQKEIFEKRFAGGPVNAWQYI